MKPRTTARLAAVILALGCLANVSAQTASTASSTTSSGTTSALDTQASQMDNLATTRGDTKVTGKIADTFTGFAGSRDNAVSLASGLRNGSEITLTSAANGGGSAESVTFMPPTRPMGHGNVYTSLALAQYRLASQGITEPTPQQIEAALMGGTITVGSGADAKTITFDGVLQMRADGMGWGQIAQALGTKLGPVVSGLRSANASIAKQPKVSSSAVDSGTSGTGITTASGAGANPRPAAGKSTDRQGKGVVNASGGSAGSGSGSAQGGRSVQNAMGVGNAYGHGGKANGQGAGIVTAAGAGAGNASAGTGIVSAASGAPGAGVAASAGRGAGVVSAAGGQGGGNANGLAKGHR